MSGINSGSELPSLGADRRAVSPVIGAILMLALAMLALSVLQTTAIPILNAEHEFQHNEEVKTDMAALSAAVDRVASTGVGESVGVDVGMRYPPRLIFINPPPVYGSLGTTEPESVAIHNATATGETGDFWDGSTRTLTTRSVRYTPAYNEYDAAPVTVFEPWAVFDRYDDRTLASSDAELVDGHRISLVTLRGSYNDSSADSLSPRVQPHSAPARTVTVSEGSGPLRLTIPTRLTNDTWSHLLSDDLASNGGSVAGYECRSDPPDGCGELTLTLVPGTYTMALGAVGIGSGISSPEPAYLTDVDGAQSSVPESGRQRLVVEARDRFDNPVSGVSIDGSVEGDPGELRAVTPETGADGRAVFTYDAPATVDRSQDVTVTTAFGAGGAAESVTFELRVIDVDGSAGRADSAALVEGIDGSVRSRPVTGSDSGQAALFDVRAAETVTVTDFVVETRNDLAGVSFADRGSTVGGRTLPAAFDGEATIDLRAFESSRNLGLRQFVDPETGQAEVVVTLEFADGGTRTFGLG